MTILPPHKRAAVQRSDCVNADVESPEMQTAPADLEVPDVVNAASMDSFPASDPPGWTGFQFGPPAQSDR